MEKLDNKIYAASSLFKIKDKVNEWDFEKLNGIGFNRGHDRYSIIELKVYEFENYPNKEKLEMFPDSYLDWKVSENQFPIAYYEYGKSELRMYAEFVIDWLSSIKGKRLNLIFEINFAGYHPTDVWGRGSVGRSFLNAIISCFDDELYKTGVEKRDKNHPLIDDINQSIFHSI